MLKGLLGRSPTLTEVAEATFDENIDGSPEAHYRAVLRIIRGEIRFMPFTNLFYKIELKPRGEMGIIVEEDVRKGVKLIKPKSVGRPKGSHMSKSRLKSPFKMVVLKERGPITPGDLIFGCMEKGERIKFLKYLRAQSLLDLLREIII